MAARTILGGLQRNAANEGFKTDIGMTRIGGELREI